MNDKDATDRLRADDRWNLSEGEPCPPVNQAKLDSGDDFKMISTRCGGVVELSRRPAGRDKACLSDVMNTALIPTVWGKLKYECVCKERAFLYKPIR